MGYTSHSEEDIITISTISLKKPDPKPIYRDHVLLHQHYLLSPRNNNKKLLPKKSYGIMCISMDERVLMNHSPPYFTQRYQYKQCGTYRFNSNMRYNLLMASFPYGTVEGQYGLPKGRIEPIDFCNTENTKIREFIEETRHYHPLMLKYAKSQDFRNPAEYFPSVFTDTTFRVQEEWVGLNNCSYWVEYTILFIKSMNEFIFIGDGHQTREFIMKEIPVIANASDRLRRAYREKFPFVCDADDKKAPVIVPLDEALFHLNTHKLQVFKSVTKKDISFAFKKYLSDNEILK